MFTGPCPHRHWINRADANLEGRADGRTKLESISSMTLKIQAGEPVGNWEDRFEHAGLDSVILRG